MDRLSSRRGSPRFATILVLAIGLAFGFAGPARAAEDGPMVVTSPDGKVTFQLLTDQSRLMLAVSFDGKQVIEPSPIVFTLDQVDLAVGTKPAGNVEEYEVNEHYAYRGVHSQASNQCNGAKITITHPSSGTSYVLEARAYNDGIAYRTIIAGGDDLKRTPDERTTFHIPEGSTIWRHDLGGHYEAAYSRSDVAQIRAGEWIGPPMTYKLPGGAYASITEAALINYSAMALEADGKRGFAIGLGHRQPVSHPFELRYKDDIERLKQPAAITGTITTPWRVVMVGADLNALVNSDIIPNCCPPPDPALFPDGINTDWVKPGRAVWRYVDGGDNSLAGMHEFSRLAGKLGLEYHVVEGIWARWSDDELRDFVEKSKQQGVGVIVWRHSNRLRTPEARKEFFDRLQQFGIAGAKIDFFDHDHKEVIDLYPILLEEAARRKLVIDFHGSGKPSGEPRTWPNELARESIRGMESRRMRERAFHHTTVPFTRFLAGHGEYTVVTFGERRQDTTAAHQIATAAVFTAPLLTYAAHPQSLLDSPAIELIKAIPATWDETRVLPPSEISRIAVFARRSGDEWFLAVLNGPQATDGVKIPLSAFLGDGPYKAMLVKDGKDQTPPTAPTTQPMGTTALALENTTMTKDDAITLDLAPGGGFIARFAK